MAEKTTDLFMQFMNLSVVSDAADSSDLVEGQVKTGLSVRGKLAMLIHSLEVFWADTSQAHSIQELAISTMKGQTTMPLISAQGTIAKMRERLIYAGAAFAQNLQRPQEKSFLPPVPISAPNISVYFKTGADEAVLRSQLIDVRIGFTTIEMSNAVLLEIAETWGY